MADRIKGLTIQIGGDTTKLTAALKDVDKSLSGTQKTLRDVNKLMKLDPGNTDLLKQKQDLLSKSISETKSRLETLQEAQKQMDTSGVDKNSDAYKGLQREIADTSEKLKSLEKQQDNFGSVGAQQIAEVGKKVQGVGSTMADIGGKMTAGITVPVVAGATAAVNAFGDVDKQFALVKQTMGTANNSAKDFQGLWKQMGDSAKNSVFGMQDAADATLNFARQGFTAKQATDMLTPAMSLAAGTGTDLSDTTAGLGNALKMFGANSEEAANYADVLAKAQAQANTNTSELFEAMSVAGPVCKTVGWDIKDLATITDIFGNAGISGSEGATALRTGLARLAAPAKDGAGTMRELGLATGQTYAIFNEDGTLKSMPDVLANLNGAFSGLTDQEKMSAASSIFGKNQMSKWLTLIQTSPQDVNALRDGLDGISGSADNMSKALMSGTGGSIETLKSTFDVLKTTIGEQVAPAFQQLFGLLTNLMNGFMNLSPETQQMILRIVAIVAALGPLLLVGGKLLVGIGQFMIYAPLIQGAITGFLGPIALVVAAIVGVIAIVVTLYKKCEWFRDGVNAVIDFIKKAFDTAVSGIKSGARSVYDFIGPIVSGIQNIIALAIQVVVAAIQDLAKLFKAIWGAIQPFVQPIIDFVVSYIGAQIKVISSVISAAFDFVKTLFTGIWDFIKGVVTAIYQVFCSALQLLLDLLHGDFDGVKRDVKALGTNILGVFKAVWNGIIGIFSGIAGWFGRTFMSIGGAIVNVVSVITSPFRAAWSGIKGLFDGIGNWFGSRFAAVGRAAAGVKNTILAPFRNAWNGIKGLFSQTISLPHISLPHFKISGSLNPLNWLKDGVPNISVDWYAKAMNKPYTFNQPSIIGVGEAGSETLVGTDWLKRHTSNTITNNISIYQQPGENADALADRVIDRMNYRLRMGQA